jgi:ComEC/Rec2-related protein
MFLYPASTFFLLLLAGIVCPVNSSPLLPLLPVGLSLILRKRYRVSDCCIVFSVILLGATISSTAKPPELPISINANEIALVQLLESVKSKPGHRTFSALVLNGTNVKGKRVYLKLTSEDTCLIPVPGDLILGRFKASYPESPIFEEAFNQKKWFKGKGWQAQFVGVYNEYIKIGNTRLPKTLEWRYKLHSILWESGLSVKTKNFVAAITLGDKSGIDYETSNAFARAGLSHILALSGLHAGLVFMLFLKSLSWIPGKFPPAKLIKFLLPCTLLWLYVFITGAGPSVLRAALMCTLIQFFSLYGRKNLGLEGLNIAAAAMLLFKPYLLVDLGFQFSYLAVAGISGIKYPFAGKNWPKIVSYILQSIWISFTAQLLTTPLSLYHFGIFPTYFFISNLFCVPLASILVTLSILLYPLHSLGKLAEWLEFLVEMLSMLLFKSVDLYQKLPVATFESLYLAFFSALFVTLALLWIAWFNRKVWLFPVLISSTLFIRIEENTFRHKSELLVAAGFIELRSGTYAFSVGKAPFLHEKLDRKRRVIHRNHLEGNYKIHSKKYGCELHIFTELNNGKYSQGKYRFKQTRFHCANNLVLEINAVGLHTLRYSLSENGLNSIPLRQIEP